MLDRDIRSDAVAQVGDVATAAECGKHLVRALADRCRRSVKPRGIQIALQRVAKNRCFLLRSHKAEFTSFRKRGACPKRWLAARGTSAWSFGINSTLPRGVYRLHARVVLTDGTVQSHLNARRFTVG